MKYNRLLIVCLILASISFVGFTCEQSGTTTQTAQTGAEQVRGFEQVQKNSKGNTVEQQSILDRIKVTTDPTKVLWIHLIALDGKIVKRMPVHSKVTSSGKRLEPTAVITGNQYGLDPPKYAGSFTNEFIQPDGTFGSSDPYIFWFDPMHRYHQWGTAGGLGYLLTDYPIDLENPMNEITGMYNMSEAAYKWQQIQEKQLRTKEGK